MAQLAYNYKGQRFILPDEAMFWRVRRLRDGQRGQLDVVRGPDGRPLVVPIDIGVDEFRAAVGDQVGRYRLDALDEQEMVVPEVEAAYVNVPMSAPAEVEDEPDSPPTPAPQRRNAAATPASTSIVTAPIGTWPALPMPATMSGTEYLLAEALRGQAQMFQALTAALSNQALHHSAATANGATQMMGAAVELIRAADGAGMSRRLPSVPPAPPAPVASPAAPVPPAPIPPAPIPPAPVPSAPSPEPRNARAGGSRHDATRFAADEQDDDDERDDEQDDDDQRDDDQDDDGYDEDDDDREDPDGGTDADMMSKMMLLADKLQGVFAPMANIAQMVMGGFGGGTRNAAVVEAEAEESVDEGDESPEAVTPPAPVLPAHLRTSHLLAIGHELPPDLGVRFRRILVAMEPADRKALTEHLCALPLEEAVADVAAKLARIPTPRYARGAGPAAAPPPVAVPPPVMVVEPVTVIEPVPYVVAAPPRVEADPDAYAGPNNGHNALDQGALDQGDTDLSGAAYDAGPGGEVTDTIRALGNANAGQVNASEPTTVAPPATEPSAQGTPATLTTPATPTASAPTALTTRPPPTDGPMRPTADPQALMMQIARHLSMTEIIQAQRLAAGLSATERAAWLARLSAMSAKQAVKTIRAELAKR